MLKRNKEGVNLKNEINVELHDLHDDPMKIVVPMKFKRKKKDFSSKISIDHFFVKKNTTQPFFGGARGLNPRIFTELSSQDTTQPFITWPLKKPLTLQSTNF